MYGSAKHTISQDSDEEEYVDVFKIAEKEMIVKTYSTETAASQLHKKSQEDQMRQTIGKLSIVVQGATDEHKSHHHHHPRSPMNSGSAGVLFVSSLSQYGNNDSSSRHLDSTGHTRSFTASNSSMDKYSDDGHGLHVHAADSARSRSSGSLLDSQQSKKLAFERMMHQQVSATSSHHKKNDNSGGSECRIGHVVGVAKAGHKTGRRLKPSSSNPSLLGDGRRKSGYDGNPDDN